MQIIKYKDGNGYISKDKSNKYKRVSQMKSSTIFVDGEAEKFILNCLPKLFRDKVEIIDIPSEEVEEPEVKAEEVPEIVETPFDNCDFDCSTKLLEEEAFLKNLAIHKKNLPSKLQRVELEICDIEHYIELNNFNASQGYKLCKLLKEKRNIRRKIKDEIYILDILYRDWVKEQKTENVLAALKSRENRKYAPRALPELFE